MKTNQEVLRYAGLVALLLALLMFITFVISCSEPDLICKVEVTKIRTYFNTGKGMCFYYVKPIGLPAYPDSVLVRNCGTYNIGEIVTLKW